MTEPEEPVRSGEYIPGSGRAAGGGFKLRVVRLPTYSAFGFGSMLAIAISYVHNQSIGWAIVHGLLSWLFVLYAALFY